ncbi:voltage-dependent calcium channel subunit alpha-2/delta-3-like isoform X2 [Scleropages formosus]|uniref:voltage-dependent calcium channel subunit alpha-2/delta-3-like isoform X2 n=1 Tax=Scleropages formosus TaxID=113540 RepID=UPI0010FAB213|nr:voltage-dependent calcium channel subunit alpha-2/delta-3-like isoform X2 [Scleropages formosus]
MLLALFIVLKRRDGERLRTDWLDADMRGKSSFSHWNVSNVASLLFWPILSLSAPGAASSQPAIPPSQVRLWAAAFGGEIRSIAVKFSGSHLLRQKYKEREKSVCVEEMDGAKLVDQLAGNMAKMFHRKAEAVRRLVKAAEDAHLWHEEDPGLQFDYFNAALVNEGKNLELSQELILQPSEHFHNLAVNFSLSVVQVPTNTYNKDSAVLNGVFWSEALNKVFVDNFGRDPSLGWQYFGSAKGFFRQYPGVKWHPDENGLIDFDCRNRKWYIQAAASPKDVVVLVDVSGSMKGLHLTMARHTVSSILDTLGDDDFFNILTYNHEIHYVEPCLNGTLVQAHKTNKDHFRELLDKLSAKGTGRLGDALREAFALLKEFHQSGRGTCCTQAVMLVTDGATETYDTVFEKFNWPQRKVRVFPYLIGREAAFADNLKRMACANKGYFTQISTLADVQENVMKYLHVLSRPKVIDEERDAVWTEAYVDSILPQAQKPEENHSPVLVTTVAMPVFSTKKETKKQGVLVGVAGTDVPVQDLLRAFPKHKLGVHGYVFAVTNNGYVLTHPELRPLFQNGKKSRKPDYSSVDLSEVERDDKEHFLRTAMVNRSTGTFSMEVKQMVDKGKRLLSLHNDYYYTHIEGTPFSLGVVLSRGRGKYVLRGNATREEGLHDLEHPDVALARGWTYCDTSESQEHRHLSQMEAVRLFLSEPQPRLKCDRELVQEVLFDAVVTAPLEAYWTSVALNKSQNSEGGVEIAFLATRTGLRRTGLLVLPEQLSSREFLAADDEEDAFSADRFPLWYRRAAEQLPGTFTYSIPFSTGSGPSTTVLASTAIQLHDGTKSPTVAALGIQMNLGFFQRKFWTACRQCAALDGKCSVSCDSPSLSCYVIDNNGFVLVSRHPSRTGLFFGEVEAAVMNQLLLTGSFKRIALHNRQAMCKITSESSDGPRSFFDPYFAVLGTVKWLLGELVVSLLEFSLHGWWHPHLTAKAQRLAKSKTTLVPCDVEHPAFVSECAVEETTGTAECDGCGRSFIVQRIPSSNLYLVVVEDQCDCSATPPVTLEPTQLIYNGSLRCDRLKSPNDRRRPDSCHPFHPEEDALDCGSALGLSPMPLLTSLALLLAPAVPLLTS